MGHPSLLIALDLVRQADSFPQVPFGILKLRQAVLRAPQNQQRLHRFPPVAGCLQKSERRLDQRRNVLRPVILNEKCAQR